MSNKASRKGLDGNRESDVGSDEAIVDRGFDRWLNRQLHRLYDPVLGEPVPDEMMQLLEQFDPKPPPARSPDEEGGS